MILRVLNFFRMTPKPLLGIDIGSSFVKIIALSCKPNDEYVIEAAYTEQLGLGNAVISTMLPKQFTEAAIGLPSSSAFSRVIQINKALNLDEVAEQIEVEAHRMIPYPLEEVYYDFEVLGPSRTHAELVDVLFVAAKIDTVNARIESIKNIKTAKNTGFKVRVVDLESLAMERAFAWIAYQLPARGVKQRVALFDIGAECMTCYVFYHFKIQYSALQSMDNRDTLIQKIQQALQQFSSMHEEAELQAIVLAGGVIACSETKDEIISSVETFLGIKTLIANPFLNRACAEGICNESLTHQAPAFMLALGLALRNFDDAN